MASVAAPKLLHVRVEKFRRVRDVVELELRTPRGRPSPLAVLAGPNGCGKTSVLEAVLLGLGREGLIVRDLDEADRESSWRTAIPEGARIEVTVSLDSGTEETWVRTHDEFYRRKSDGTRVAAEDPPPPWGGPPRKAREAFEDGALRTPLLVEYFSSWRSPKLVGPVKPLDPGHKRVAYNEANRLRRLKQRIADELVRRGVERSKAGVDPGKLERWMEQLNRAWRRFHRNDGTKIDYDLIERDDGPVVDLFVTARGGDDLRCPVDQLSSGEIELILFAQWVILNDVRAGLLVIDEPELHLHPSWQATILPALRELGPDVQFLVATHSDAVWDQANERFLLVDESDPRSSAWRLAHPLPGDEEAES